MSTLNYSSVCTVSSVAPYLAEACPTELDIYVPTVVNSAFEHASAQKVYGRFPGLFREPTRLRLTTEFLTDDYSPNQHTKKLSLLPFKVITFVIQSDCWYRASSGLLKND